MKKYILTLTMALVAFLGAQDLVDLTAPYTSYTQSGLLSYPLNTRSVNTQGQLSAAVGYATVATGQMIPEMTVNPANLAAQRFGSFQISGLFSADGTARENAVNTISYINPVKVYQGSLVWGISMDRQQNFLLKYSDDEISQKTEGGMKNWKMSLGLEALEDVYLGFSMGLLTGYRENDIEYLDAGLISAAGTEGYVEDVDYVGLSSSIGLTYRPYRFLTLGASLDLPTPMEAEHVIRQYNNASSSFDYSLLKPAVYRGGLALTMKYVDIYYSVDMTNWNELYFQDADLLGSVEDEINREVEDNLTNSVSQHIGVALHVPMIPLHLYGGYQYLPDADALGTTNLFSLANLKPSSDSDRFSSSFSWGASFFMKNGLSLTASFETDYLYQDGELTTPKSNSLALTYFF